MKNIIDYFKTIRFTSKSVPWLLLIVCVLAFGLLVPDLGFFQDDWNFIFNYYSFGNKGLIEFLQYDGRPFAAWIFLTGFSILGFKPIYWHIAELLIRWLTGFSLWLVFRTLWPNHRWPSLMATLIFLLYPFFTLQPLAVTYTLHWTGYLLYAVSIYFMLTAMKKNFWLYTVLSLITQALHLFTLEFFSGIELLRPVLLWLMLSKSEVPARDKIKSVLLKWAPYLAIFTLYFVWRGFFYQAAAQGRNTPLLLTALMNNPISTILETVNNGIADIALILISSWYKILDPSNLDFSNSANRYIFLISIFSFCLLYFYLSRQDQFTKERKSNPKQYIVVGVIALILSLLPVYAAGFVINTKIEPWNSRLSLGSLLGASLIITGVIEYVVETPKTKWGMLSIIFGLLIGWHLQYTNDFRWAWAKQVNFYRQLHLRAPYIKPGTAILSEEEFMMFMGDYPVSYGINLIYSNQGYGFDHAREADYWFYPLSEFQNRLDEYLAGRSFSATRAGTVFEGESEGSIVISFEPELGRCLWVMRPEYASSKFLSQNMRKLASISYPGRIHPIPENKDSFMLKYLDIEPGQDWCYFYERADLAGQLEEWNEVIHIWEAASENGEQPDNGFEYLPFIEAYGHAGDWKIAKKMTDISQKTMQGIEPLLCITWANLDSSTQYSPVKEGTVSEVMDILKCDQY